MRTALTSSSITAHVLPKAESVVVTIPELDGAVFEHYARFISFIKPLDTHLKAVNGLGHPLEKEFTWKECRKYIALYMFGAEVHDKEFQKYVLQELGKWLQPLQPPDLEILECIMQAATGNEELQEFVLQRMFAGENKEHEALKISGEEEKRRDSRGVVVEEMQQFGPHIPLSSKVQIHKGGGEDHNIAPSTKWQPVPDLEPNTSRWRPPSNWDIQDSAALAPDPEAQRKASQMPKFARLSLSKVPVSFSRVSDDGTHRASRRRSALPKMEKLGRDLLSAVQFGRKSHASSSFDEGSILHSYRRKSMSDLAKTDRKNVYRRSEPNIHHKMPQPSWRTSTRGSLDSVVTPKTNLERESQHEPVPRLRAPP
jgi:hypothetical protein